MPRTTPPPPHPTPINTTNPTPLPASNTHRDRDTNTDTYDPESLHHSPADPYHPLYNPFSASLTHPPTAHPSIPTLLFSSPLSPLLIPVSGSSVRDHCANERTYLSYIRLSIYLNIVSVAIYLNFHLKHQPTPFELSVSRPLGAVFWILGLLGLAAGVGNYAKTLREYAERRSVVQSGWKTAVVMAGIAVGIVCACGIFIGAGAGVGSGSESGSGSGSENGSQVGLSTSVDVDGMKMMRMGGGGALSTVSAVQNVYDGDGYGDGNAGQAAMNSWNGNSPFGGAKTQEAALLYLLGQAGGGTLQQYL